MAGLQGVTYSKNGTGCKAVYANGNVSYSSSPCPTSIMQSRRHAPNFAVGADGSDTMTSTNMTTSNKKWMYAIGGAVIGGVGAHFMKKDMKITVISALVLGAIGYYIGMKQMM